jgi:hypothetical protein
MAENVTIIVPTAYKQRAVDFCNRSPWGQGGMFAVKLNSTSAQTVTPTHWAGSGPVDDTPGPGDVGLAQSLRDANNLWLIAQETQEPDHPLIFPVQVLSLEGTDFNAQIAALPIPLFKCFEDEVV